METVRERIVVSEEIEVVMLCEVLSDSSVVYNVEIHIGSYVVVRGTHYCTQKEATTAMNTIADNLTFFKIK